MLEYHIKNFLRYVIIVKEHPKSGVAFFLKYIGKFPFFRYSIERNNDSLFRKKASLRGEKKNVGHAFEEKIFKLYFLKWRILQFRLAEGEELTAEHFFLNRPVDDVRCLLEFAADYISINDTSLIFDPGCGTGRHLFYLVDKYRCRGVGVDVYPPAISIARKINIGQRIDFYNRSTLEDGLLENSIPEGCDYVFINSWLNHVYSYNGYGVFVDKLLCSCKYLLVITSMKYELKDLVPNGEILVERTIGKEIRGVKTGTRYAVIKGRRSSKIE